IIRSMCISSIQCISNGMSSIRSESIVPVAISLPPSVYLVEGIHLLRLLRQSLPKMSETTDRSFANIIMPWRNVVYTNAGCPQWPREPCESAHERGSSHSAEECAISPQQPPAG